MTVSAGVTIIAIVMIIILLVITVTAVVLIRAQLRLERLLARVEQDITAHIHQMCSFLLDFVNEYADAFFRHNSNAAISTAVKLSTSTAAAPQSFARATRG